MKVIFMGAPAFAVPSLMAVIEHGLAVAAVYTKAPKPAGRRGLEIDEEPVHLAAEAAGAPGRNASTLRDPQALERLRRFAAPIWRWSPPMVCCCRRRCSPRRGLVVSIFTPRCCRDGAARRRFSAPSWPAMRRPASRSCGWRPGSTPARSLANCERRSALGNQRGAHGAAGGACGPDPRRQLGRAR